MNSSSNAAPGRVRIGCNNPQPILNSFERLFRTQSLTDVTLICQGESINCHKIILVAGSTFFEKNLLGNECYRPTIHIEAGIKFTELKKLLDYMYRGEVVVPEKELDAFLKAAEVLQVKGLADTKDDKGKKEQHQVDKVTAPNGNATASSSCTSTQVVKKYKTYPKENLVLAVQAVQNGMMSALSAARAYKVPARTVYERMKKLGVPRGSNLMLGGSPQTNTPMDQDQEDSTGGSATSGKDSDSKLNGN